MARQSATRRDYRAPDGAKIPGVTTVLGDTLGWSKGALIAWAHRLGKEGRSLSERDAAADKGTATHALAWAILGHDDGTEISDAQREECEPNARRVADAILARWTIVAIERAIVGDGYAGTIDLIARDGEGRIGIVDLKTGRGIYDEVAIQLGAYAALWDGASSETPASWAAVIHAPAGEPIEIIDVPWDSITTARRAFFHLLDVYRAKKSIKVKP